METDKNNLNLCWIILSFTTLFYFTEKSTVEIVSPSVASALDRTGISNRVATFLLAAAVDSLGLPV